MWVRIFFVTIEYFSKLFTIVYNILQKWPETHSIMNDKLKDQILSTVLCFNEKGYPHEMETLVIRSLGCYVKINHHSQ